MGDAQGSALVAVRQVQPEMLAVGEQLDDVTDALAADDDHDLGDPHAGQRGDRVVDHRPVVDRQQMLVRDDCQREQARGGAARENDSLHRASKKRVPKSLAGPYGRFTGAPGSAPPWATASTPASEWLWACSNPSAEGEGAGVSCGSGVEFAAGATKPPW